MAAFATDRLFGFALIVLITRWWSPASVGQWTQMVALTGAFAVVTSLGLFQAHVRIAEESADPRVRRSLQLSIVTATTLAMGMLTLLAMTARHTVARWAFGTAEDATLVLAVCFLATSDLWMEFVTTQFRAQLHTGQTALLVAGKAVMRFVIVAVFAVRQEGGLSTIVALLAAVQALTAWLIMVTKFDGLTWLSVGFAPGAHLYRRAVAMAGPTIVAGVAAQLFVTAERWFLARTAPAMIAHYNVGLQIASNAMLAYIILGSMLYPMMVRAWQAGDRQGAAALQRDGIAVYALTALPLLAILPVISRAVVAVIATRYYEIDGATMFLFLLGAFGFGIHQLAGYTMYVAERTTDLLLLLCGAALVKVGLSALLIPRWGEFAAALSWGVSGVVLAIATVVRCHGLLPFEPAWRSLVRSAVVALACGSALAALTVYVDSGQQAAAVLGAGGVAVLIYFSFVWQDLQTALAFRRGQTG